MAKKDTHEIVPGGCHATHEDARKHLAALVINVEDSGGNAPSPQLQPKMK